MASGSMEALDVVELTRRLVSVPSVTGEEGALGAQLADELTKRGWQVTKQEVPPEHGRTHPPRWNILATRRPGPPRVVLTTHIDTVPPFIPVSEDDDYLYGRGTCDAKGIFAAQWIAAERLVEKGVDDVALLAICGEETDSIGAKVAHEVLPKAAWIIDGEPTDLTLTSGAKGILALKLRSSGVAGHSAYPERGRSAVHALIAALGRLASASLPALQAYGDTTVNVGRIEGGVAPNVIAPSASAELMIRLAAPADEVLAEVTRAIQADEADEAEGPRIEIEVTSSSEPHQIHVPDGYEGMIVRFGSDVPYLSKIGVPLLVGPGSIHDAHTSHEKVGKAALAQAVDLYCALAQTLS